jgi:hypothetical protein
MDESYLLSAVRYVEKNPTVANLCDHSKKWEWSSARSQAHFMGKDNKLVSVKSMLERIDDWEAYLLNIDIGGNTNMIKQHTRTRRPSPSGMPASFNKATNARQERGVVVASLITTGHPAAKAMRLS